MGYYHRTVYAGRAIEHRKEYTNRVHTKGVKRSPNRGPTPQNQTQINERIAEEHLRWTINANFGYRDLHVALHWCRKEGITFQEILDCKRRFMARLRKECKKRGIPYRAVVVIETERMKTPHIHLVITRMDAELLQALWEDIPAGGGRISFQYLDKRGNHYKLAHYLIKESRTTMELYAELGIRGKRYTTTQGMAKPVIRYRKVAAASWREEPKARKGTYLYMFDDGSTYRSGWHEVSGWPYQEYFEVLNE